MCRSRRELSNAYLLAKFGLDTAENEPCKVCPLSAYRSPRYDPEAMGEDIWHEHPLMLCVFLAYFFLANFTVLNMLIGILCDVISDTQASEKMKAKVREVEEKISLVYDSIDVDGSGKISAHEFDMIKNLDEVRLPLRIHF